MNVSIFFYIVISALQVGLIYALISLGFNLLYSSTRIINVAYGEFIVLGGYITLWLYTLYSIPPPLTLPLVIALSAVISVPLYYLLFEPVLKSKNVEYIEVWGVIIAFGLSIVMQGLMTLAWSAQSRAYTYLEEVVSVGGVTITLNRVVVIAISAVLIALLYYLLFRTDFGVSMRSVIQDPSLAETLGLNVRRVFLLAFVISFVIAGMAGVLVSMISEISPFTGTTYMILAFVITVIGGIGNPAGSLVGGLVLGFLDVLIGYTVGPGLNLFIIYSLLVFILITRPSGLLGRG